MIKKFIIRTTVLGLIVVAIGFLIPQNLEMPVEGATSRSYNQGSFWDYPWGKSVTHKGVDIFAKEGTPVKSATLGLVLFKGKFPRGGNAVLILGPKWRYHYYAHLKEASDTSMFSLVGHNDVIGMVGDTGNAKGTPPHLHYEIKTLFPYPWQADDGPHGLRKIFYVNPIKYLN